MHMVVFFFPLFKTRVALAEQSHINQTAICRGACSLLLVNYKQSFFFFFFIKSSRCQLIQQGMLLKSGRIYSHLVRCLFIYLVLMAIASFVLAFIYSIFMPGHIWGNDISEWYVPQCQLFAMLDHRNQGHLVAYCWWSCMVLVLVFGFALFI